MTKLVREALDMVEYEVIEDVLKEAGGEKFVRFAIDNANHKDCTKIFSAADLYVHCTV